MYNFQEGEVLLIDKPLEWTSFDVVKKIRNNIRIKKVGHAGTLDPLASGLLIVCTGKKTKTINDLMGQEKEYTGIIQLGASTPTLDKESEVDETFPTEHITAEKINTIKKQFIGEIDQVPPIFSAIKVNGKRLYKSARQGQEVEIEPRKVEIIELEFTKFEGTELHFRVVCSKGTYIRSLARDIGKALESGGYLTELRRTRIGDHLVKNAKTVQDFVNEIQKLKDEGTFRP